MKKLAIGTITAFFIIISTLGMSQGQGYINPWIKTGITEVKSNTIMKTEKTKEIKTLELDKDSKEAPSLIGKELKPSITDIEGKVKVDLSKGEHIVYFFASWCTYCEAAIPNIRDYEDASNDKVIKISSESTQELFDYTKGAYHVFKAPDDKFWGLDIQYYPTFLKIKNGKVVGQFVGVPSPEGLKALYKK